MYVQRRKGSLIFPIRSREGKAMRWDEKDIIYEDRDILITYKPAGMPVESRRIDVLTLERCLKNRLYARQGSGNVYLSAVNRIDQVVEGIVLFAKNKRSAAALSEQMRKNEIEKVYVAATASEVSEKEGELLDYLVKEKTGNRSRIAGKDEAGAKKALLNYRLLGTDDQGNSLIRIRLHTGRHHQIRVQMAAAGMPLVNDRKYGAGAVSEGGREYKGAAAGISRESKGFPAGAGREFKGFAAGRGGNTEQDFPALCAREISFIHPASKKRMHFEIIPRGKVYLNFIGLFQ